MSVALSELRVGDTVRLSSRTRPVEVVETGIRAVTDERIPKTIETPLVRVRGDWDGAVERVLAHKLNRWDDGIQLEETDAIVACESTDLQRGELVTVDQADNEAGRVEEVA